MGWLLSAIYFGAGMHRARLHRPRRPAAPRDQVQALHGPSRRLVFTVVVMWLAALALLAHLAIVVVHGLYLR